MDEKFEEIRKKRERLESERKREIELKKQRNAQKDLEMKRIIVLHCALDTWKLIELINRKRSKNKRKEGD